MDGSRILITHIQRFSLHDGPGIRTTVFLKGCSLRCPWCSNPENLISEPQPYMKDGVSGTCGKYITPKELTKECLKDKVFYEGKINNWNITTADDIEKLPGGVSFSGGEALLQMPALIPVITSLHEADVHVAVETCLFIPPSHLALALHFIDFFYVDVKMLAPGRCKEFEHGDLGLYLDNLDTLLTWKDENGKNKPVVVRIPVIGKYTDTVENRKEVHELIRKYQDHILKIELIKEHSLGENKYQSLNMHMEYHGVSDRLMETYKAELEPLGIPVEICKI